MEAFSLLRYWRGTTSAAAPTIHSTANVRTPTAAAAPASPQTSEGDDGPYFDLEFAVPDEEDGCSNLAEDGDGHDQNRNEEIESEEEEDEDNNNSREFKFTLSSSSGDYVTDPNVSAASPSDDLFFKGRLVPDGDDDDTLSIVLNGSDLNNPKSQFPISLLKSATKFRVLMLKLKKPKWKSAEKTEQNASVSDTHDPQPESQQNQKGDKKTEKNASVSDTHKPSPESQQNRKRDKKTDKNASISDTPKPPPPESQQNQKRDKKTEQNASVADDPKPQPPESHQQNHNHSKFFTIKLKIEEVPIISLFTRDSSSRATSKTQKPQKQENPEESTSDEKRFSTDVMQKYLKMVKPLYFRVSKRYGDKLGFSGQLSIGPKTETSPPPAQAPAPELQTLADVAEAPPATASIGKIQKQVSLPAGLRVVCKHLGKSRSGSSAVVAATCPAGPGPSRRRDDSLLQQQDGIQSAIMHCKRSFNPSRDSESSSLSRSGSDSSSEKNVDP